MTESSRSARRAIVGVLFALLIARGAAAKDLKLTVRGQGADLGETPVLVELPSKSPTRVVLLRPDRAPGATPGLVFEDNGKSYLGFVLNGLEKDQAVGLALLDGANSSEELVPN